MHKELAIVKGVAKAIGDANSAEQGLTVVSITPQQHNGAAGIYLDSGVEGWQPQIAQSKGGLWADNDALVGRTLMSISDQNVVETMQLQVVSDSQIQTSSLMVNLRRMGQEARDFWTTQTQIEPVYLRWWALGAPGYQYALIYNMDIAESIDVANPNYRSVTLTIEREPYWRGIAPGANPKEWTAYASGINLTTADYDLTTTPALKRETVWNRHEWDSADYSSPLEVAGVVRKNYMTLSKNDLPGDVSPLVTIYAEVTAGSPYTALNAIYVGAHPGPHEFTALDGDVHNQTIILNAGDAQVETGWTKVNDSTKGVISDNQNTLEKVAQFLGINTDKSLIWSKSSNDAHYTPDINVLRGTFAVFVRGWLQVAASGVRNLFVDFGEMPSGALSTFGSEFSTLGPLDLGTITTSTEPNMIYMGTIQLPLTGKSVVKVDGLGLDVHPPNLDDAGNLAIRVRATASDATFDFRVVDLWLMPINHGFIHVDTDSSITFQILIDGSGYLNHGEAIMRAAYIIESAAVGFVPIALVSEIRGAALALQPGIDNRLYFLFLNNTPQAHPEVFADVLVHIVPRWRGVRDV